MVELLIALVFFGFGVPVGIAIAVRWFGRSWGLALRHAVEEDIVTAEQANQIVARMKEWL